MAGPVVLVDMSVLIDYFRTTLARTSTLVPMSTRSLLYTSVNARVNCMMPQHRSAHYVIP